MEQPVFENGGDRRSIIPTCDGASEKPTLPWLRMNEVAELACFGVKDFLVIKGESLS